MKVNEGFTMDGGPSDPEVYRLLQRSVVGVDDVGAWYVVDEHLTPDGWVLSFQDREGSVSQRRIRIEHL
jgi:hypothetical protein